LGTYDISSSRSENTLNVPASIQERTRALTERGLNIGVITFSLEPVPPFRLDRTVWVLRRSTNNVIDRWDGNTYRLVLIMQEQPLEVEVVQTGSSDKPLLHVTTNGNALPPDAKTFVTSALTRMLGTNVDMTEFYRFAEYQPKLDVLALQFEGVKPPRFPTIFEALVNAMACQQVSLTVGILFINRLAERYGQSIEKQGVSIHGFPDPEKLALLAPEALRTLVQPSESRAIIDWHQPFLKNARTSMNWRISTIKRQQIVCTTSVVWVAGPPNTSCCVGLDGSTFFRGMTWGGAITSSAGWVCRKPSIIKECAIPLLHGAHTEASSIFIYC